MLVDIVRSFFFCTVHLKKKKNFSNSHSLQVFFNKCWRCKWEGSAEKTQDCSANKHINYLLKHEGGGNKISWLQRHNFRSAGGAEGKTNKREAAF